MGWPLDCDSWVSPTCPQPFFNGGSGDDAGLRGLKTSMSLIPLFPIAASPSLPLALHRLALTPSARLAKYYRLVPRDEPIGGCRPRAISLYHPPRRSVAQAWIVDELVTAGVIGTRLAILDPIDTDENSMLARQGAPTIGKNINLLA